MIASTSPLILLPPIVKDLDRISEELRSILEAQEDVYEALSERLKESPIGLAHEARLDTLEHAYDSVLDALAYLEDLLDQRRVHAR